MLIGFDLDGTLIDSVGDLAMAVNTALSSHEAIAPLWQRVGPFSDALVKTWVGRGAENLLRSALTHTFHAARYTTTPALQSANAPSIYIAQPLLDEVRRLFSRYYLTHLDEKTTVYAGLLPALQQLRDAGYTLAIATNKPKAAAMAVVERLLPNQFVSVWAPEDVGGILKPDPTILQALSASLSQPMLAYVGDSAIDLHTARAFGVPCLAAGWGWPNDEMQQHADVVISHPSDLLDAMRRLAASLAAKA